MHMLIEPLTDRPLTARPKWPVAFWLPNGRLSAKASGHFFGDRVAKDHSCRSQLIRSIDLFELVLRKLLDRLWFGRAGNLHRYSVAVNADHPAECARFGLYPVTTV